MAVQLSLGGILNRVLDNDFGPLEDESCAEKRATTFIHLLDHLELIDQDEVE